MTIASRYGPGDLPSSWMPGDFIVTHGSSIVSRLIRFGERLEYGRRSPFTRYNHAALVGHGCLIEALSVGVTRSPLDKYRPAEFHVVRIDASDSDRAEAVAFAEACIGQRYGWVTIASVALMILTRRRLVFAIDGTEICSGLVARAQERCGEVFRVFPGWNSPANLLEHYRVKV